MSVITISREYGSQAEKIAQQVAERLGYSYFDKEILADVARAARTTEDKISLYDEKDEHGLRSFLKKLFVPEYPFPYYYSPDLPMEWSMYPIERGASIEKEPILKADEVVSFFRHVVEKLWKRGNVVIVGRSSQRILAAKPDTLHVRFIGAIEDRCKNVMQQEGITHSDALEKIQKIDKQRLQYLKHYYNMDGADETLYHLVLNTSLMRIEQAVKVIIAAVCHHEA